VRKGIFQLAFLLFSAKVSLIKTARNLQTKVKTEAEKCWTINKRDLSVFGIKVLFTTATSVHLKAQLSTLFEVDECFCGFPKKISAKSRRN
jgi:hypothetical protein